MSSDSPCELSRYDISCPDGIQRGASVTENISEAVFQILLSLADRPRHGLGIAGEVEERTGHRVRLGAGTLYTALGRMRDDGWIAETAAPPGEEDRRRRFYAVTEAGRQVLGAEARRMETLVRDARGKAVLPGGRSSLPAGP